MCYCCKLKCKKVTLGLFAAATIIPAILLFAYGGLLKNFLNQYVGYDSSANAISGTVVGIVLGFGAIAFFISMLGIIAACCFQRCCNKCCMCMYSGLAFLFSIIFLALGIVFTFVGVSS